MAFFAKTFSFVARPEFNRRSPRSLKKATQVPDFFEKKAEFGTAFYYKTVSRVKKMRMEQKKNLK